MADKDLVVNSWKLRNYVGDTLLHPSIPVGRILMVYISHGLTREPEPVGDINIQIKVNRYGYKCRYKFISI